jgi:glutathione S-transferase
MNNYILYGSKTSPFVRRIRMLMENTPFDFKEINIFESEGAQILKTINPINQIPVLSHGEVTVWDSRQIFNYLNNIHHYQDMKIEDENLLTAIDGAMNAGVSLLLMHRSGIDKSSDAMYVKRQRERIFQIIDYLEPTIQNELTNKWNFHSMSLYAFFDWLKFREIVSIENRTICNQFLNAHVERKIINMTKIET